MDIEGQVGMPYETGLNCPDCGLPLREFIFFGKIIKLECPCAVKAREIEEEKRKERARAERIDRLKRTSGIPPKYINCSFDNFTKRDGVETALRDCEKYADKFGTFDSNLMLVGGVGSGKTHLACALGNRVIERGYSVKFIRAADLPYEIQKTYDDPTLSASDVIEPLRRCALLIIDDIGSDRMTEFDRGVLQSLVDYRLQYKRPIVSTTNLTEKELLQTIDSRTVDRLFGESVVRVCRASSYRRMKKVGD